MILSSNSSRCSQIAFILYSRVFKRAIKCALQNDNLVNLNLLGVITVGIS